MSTQTGTNPSTTPLATTWRYLAAVGLLISLLGVVAIVAPLVTGLALSALLGALLVVSGVSHGVHVFSARGWIGALSQGLLALLYVVGGIVTLVNPVLGLTTLTLVLAVVFVFNGVLEIFMGLRLRSRPNWWWPIASGVLALAVGVLLWIGWPSTAEWAIGLLFGVNLLSSGLSMVFLALNGRRAARDGSAIGT
ncbi:HdeD family acid-resistance protein [Halococcus dombrowskii]|uniref:HdeD family acid-resistance protein n=1 Tax=Halococcus dombrowskii TaxID=179637 RepID=UPI0031DFE915